MKSRTNTHRMLDRAKERDAILRRLSLDLTAERDRRFMLEAVALDGELLQFAAPELLDDRRFVLAATFVSPGALAHASDRLRANRKVVRQAVQWWHWLALSDAAPALRSDPELRRLAERRFDEIHGLPGE